VYAEAAAGTISENICGPLFDLLCHPMINLKAADLELHVMQISDAKNDIVYGWN
jgi:hypothetical protein